MASTGNLTAARRALTICRALGAGTPDRALLTQWPGWGVCAPAFDPHPTGPWAELAGAFTETLIGEEHAAAALSLDTAFYTPPHIVEQIWQLLTGAGFTGGRVFYPGMGPGTFLEHAPSQLPLDVTGVEVDLVTAKIASLLHPDATVHAAALQQTTIPTGGFDLAIGNVPFSSARVFDRAMDGGYMSLHNYCLHRAVAAVRPGGYVAAITSTSTMDSAAMTPLLAETDLVAALRLPAGTFPGTEAAADLLLLRRPADDDAAKPRWVLDVLRTSASWSRPQIAAYWLAHPHHVAGTMTPSSNPKGPSVTVTAGNPAEQTRAAFAAVAAAMIPYTDDTTPTAAHTVALVDAEGRKERSFHLIDGDCVRVMDGALTPVKRSAELVALIEMRDAACDLMAAEADHGRTDTSLDELRTTARDAYRGYVRRWGPVNRGHLAQGKVDPETGMPALSWRRPRLGGFRGDPDAPLVAALEVYDPDTNIASEAPLLHRRVNKPYVPPTSANSPTEALAVTLGESGHVDPDRLGELLACTPAEALTALGDRVFCDPDTGRWARAADYLSGNIAQRLDTARAAATTDPAFEPNVAALEAVLPTRLGPEDIWVSLGVTWVAAADVSAFTADVLGRRANVEYCETTGTWNVDYPTLVPPAAETVYGSPDMDAYRLLSYALNGKPAIVYDTDYRTGQKIRNSAKTLAAQTHTQALQQAFAEWVWTDPDRSQRLQDTYNARFNVHVPRHSDGSHLTFHGLSDTVTPWPWQYDVVDQVLSTPATLCAHAVGSGKTLSAVAAAVMLRRFGLATKPMIAVPNHLLEQIAREAQQAFPDGRFLVAGKDDLAGSARRLFAARCATGDWDAVIVTHNSFGSIPLTPRTERDWINQQVDELQDALRNTDYGFGSKEIARRLRSLKGKLDKLRGNVNDPDTVYFEHLGIDHISIDEAHLFKRLATPTMALARTGFSFGASQRATDLKIKIDLLRDRNPDRPHVAFYTGSTWSNSMAETYVWQSYLAPDRLAEAGVETFPAWAAQFVSFEARVEPSPDGATLRTAIRPSRVKNGPELRAMFGEFADILTTDQIPLDRPTRNVTTVTVAPGPKQRRYVGSLVELAAKIHNGTATKAESMLTVCTAGRRVALDPRLIGLDEDSPKVAAIADRVSTIYTTEKDRVLPGAEQPGVFQLVFCDQGVPRPGDAQTYGRLRTALIERGVPADQIRFVHEATDDKAKAALFAACRNHEVAVLIASTEKAGLGTNIQRHLRAIHHADPTWRPTDMDQREGRGLRPGNLCPEVEVVQYVTEGTFDTFMFATLARKARFIEQMLHGDSTMRTFADIGPVELAFVDVAAIASGNPLLRQHAEAVEAVRTLRIKRGIATRSLNVARQHLDQATDRRGDALTRHSVTRQALAQLTDPNPDDDSDALHELIQHGSRRWHGTPWRGLHLQLLRHDNRYGLAVLLRRYDEAAQLNLSPSEAKSPHKLAQVLDQWIANLPAVLTAATESTAAADTDIAAAQRIIDEWTFPQQDELAAAEGHLAQIEAQMQESLDLAA